MPPVGPSSTGRFAPSTTGEAHPGTLLSALLVWLDARHQGGRALMRLENLDHLRCRPAWASQMIEATAWLGLAWDEIVVQTERGAAHAQALDTLAAAGRLYACSCSRRDRSGGRRAPDGGWAYDNTCRGRGLPAGGWRAATEPVRARLDDGRIELVDEGGRDLSQDPAAEMGDPVVRRRDGVVAYHLAVVVDDADAGVTRVVRGHDLATSTATQVALYRLLGLPVPTYRHHLLLLERVAGVDGAARKLAKLHGSLPLSHLQRTYTGAEVVGHLACAIGLTADARPMDPAILVEDFTWRHVSNLDHEAYLDGEGRMLIEVTNALIAQ